MESRFAEECSESAGEGVLKDWFREGLVTISFNFSIHSFNSSSEELVMMISP
jgi:hypothetical protein